MRIYRRNHTREAFAAHRSVVRNIAVAVFGVLWLLHVALVDSLPSFAAPLVVEPSADGVQRATIIMESYSYVPDHLVLQVGSPVELILENKSWLVPHNFILQDADLRLEADVAGGDRTTLRFTPTRSGTGTFYCDKKLLFFKSHRHRGMEGRIDIQ
ncbi:MAG: hypothetical protein NTAFB01_15400 [Nitrospira sp.]